MSDRTVSTFKRQHVATLEAVRNVTGGFDIDAWHAMEQRDDRLIEEELLTGHLSSKFVYNIPGLGSGVSAVGARHLADAYGGIKLRLVGSIHKVGQMLTFKSYPSPGMPMSLQVSVIPELAEEMDWYEVVVEAHNIKTGNYTQAEKRELAKEKKRDGSWYDRPNYPTIAQSKAKRNATLELIPQDVIIRWKAEMIALGNGVELTDSVIDQKRNAVIQFAASKAITIDRRALEDMTLSQIGGLSEAAHTKDLEQFRASAESLGLVLDRLGERRDGERGVVSIASTTSPADKKVDPAKQPTKTDDASKAETGKAKEEERDTSASDKAAETQGETGGKRFEAQVLDLRGDPIDRGAMIYDPVVYARKLLVYLSGLAPGARAQAWDWNGSAVEEAEENEEAARILATIKETPADDGTTDKTAAESDGGDKPRPLTVKLERNGKGEPNYRKLVADCARDLEDTDEADLDRWWTENEAHWAEVKLPPQTRAAIQRMYSARRAPGWKPAAEAMVEATNEVARISVHALTICQEIDRVTTATECRDLEMALFDPNSALGRMFAAVREAGGDRFANIRTVFEAKAKEVGHTLTK